MILCTCTVPADAVGRRRGGWPTLRYLVQLRGTDRLRMFALSARTVAEP